MVKMVGRSRGGRRRIDYPIFKAALTDTLSLLTKCNIQLLEKQALYCMVYNTYYKESGHKMHNHNDYPTDRLVNLVTENLLNAGGWKTVSRKMALKFPDGQLVIIDNKIQKKDVRYIERIEGE